MLAPLMGLWLIAQDAARKPIETAHLTLTPTASAAAVAAGGKVTLRLDVIPKAKMHVYAPGQDGYIAIALALDADPAIAAAPAKYPPGETYVMPALQETQRVYSQPFRITEDVTVKSGAGEKRIKGTVRYQACDDRICYLPKTVPVEWTVRVEGRR